MYCKIFKKIENIKNIANFKKTENSKSVVSNLSKNKKKVC